MPQYDAKLVRGTNSLGTSERLGTEDTQQDIKDLITPASSVETQNLITVGTTAVEITFTGTTGTVVLYSADNNSGTIFIGNSDVENDGDKSFATLLPGQTRAFPYNDSTNALYAISSIANQKLSASLFIGYGSITFDGFDSRVVPHLTSISSNVGGIYGEFTKTDYVRDGNVLVAGAVDFPYDNTTNGYDKVRKCSNEGSGNKNSGGDWYGCTGRDLLTGGGLVTLDISRQNLDHLYRALESAQFTISNNVGTPEVGAVRISVYGYDNQVGGYCPKAICNLSINEGKLTDNFQYLSGMRPNVMAWDALNSRYGYIEIQDVGGTLSSTETIIDILLEDYTFDKINN